MYYLPQPPYFLLLVGLLTGITCGAAFEATLKTQVKEWLKKPADQILKDSGLEIPFLGICLGICVFLSSGLEIFLLDPWLSYSIALPLTIFIGALVWIQLEKVLQQLKFGGSKAIDLDAF
ncbi:conserved hypothetical protein [Rippkaea orientalis PCC 8801]|uniref:Uncharacterized protein n=1 Tax=Rippkaea orientalis (strain PCC 8801 / RF-1) TaxID=41431 RepID=B7JXA7_RIPO1|nr:hypothetical protein [Rippkaea orientalis]ACK67095.1 conserved hypothetical protein [Rippkaea orientalis PCC 8801]